MDNLTVKGDEVRHGASLYLDALSGELIDSLGDAVLSEAMLRQLNDGSAPITPLTGAQIARHVKTSGEMVLALRLRADDRCIGACRLGDIGWQGRHALLEVAIVDEAHYTVDMLADAIRTLLQFAYWEANLNRIYVHCAEDNTTLLAALKQAGFTDEGRLRQEVYRDGRYLDKVVFSMLSREWSG